MENALSVNSKNCAQYTKSGFECPCDMVNAQSERDPVCRPINLDGDIVFAGDEKLESCRHYLRCIQQGVIAADGNCDCPK